ncbi:hypothetical protein BBJ29_002299 [Phytophthora kernoviae]|uniref:Uncharacterized protein n=1 Tax=Phytophthora kernoviae TaxID=325452 RepID=A0A3F2RY66_9STRA|nr:hypothetical protein BBP00_00002220 [Phytophthora kernoviae]RLN70315.1 hypothetical protein BBJ29_002299 [Phytophthora kernoviae]
MEAVHDHYLCAFVADASGDISIPNATSPAKRDLELQTSRLNMHNNFVMGARVTKTDKGAVVLMVGSARFELPNSNDPAFDLLQHILWLMPVYEDLHLSAVALSTAN